MRRFVGAFLLAWLVTLASGVVEFAHNAQHAHDDARVAPAPPGFATYPQRDDRPAAPVHDASNCRLHATLHAPLIAAPAVSNLGIDKVIDRVAPVAAWYVSARIPGRLDCRGPPALV